MINNKTDYRFYIQEDCQVNTGRKHVNPLKLLLNCYYGNDGYRAYRYLKTLRDYEYLLNCRVPFKKMRLLVAKFQWHRLGAQYGINIKPNVVGYGLRIPHVVGGG